MYVNHLPRVLPVSEALSVMVRTTTKGEDQGEDYNANDSDNLERGQPEFQFSKDLDTKVIDNENGDEEDGDEHTRVHPVTIDPELDSKGGSRQLVGSDDDVLEPIPTLISDLHQLNDRQY